MTSDPEVSSDLTECDLEPITRLERIQSFGFLLVMTSNWSVLRASANLEEFIGTEAGDAIGQQLDALVDPEALHDLRNRMTGLSSIGGIERLYGVLLVAGRPALDLAVHYAGGLCILEGEAAGSDCRIDAASLVRTMVARLTKHHTLDAFHRDAVHQFRGMTGFTRAMIYRFGTDGSGEVVAEEVGSEMESFLGLCFPASDIPVQARALYLLNPFRIIANVNAETIPIVASPSDREPAVDLSLAITRAVSLVHIEYLRNMGVAASLSISIIVEGRLWGLVVCHDRAPRLPTFVIRTAAELFGEMYSMKLESRLRQAEDLKDSHARAATEQMISAIAGNPDQLSHASWLQDALGDLIECDGVAARFDGRLSLSGSTPPASAVEEIAALMTQRPETRLLMSDQIGSLVAGAHFYVDRAAGVLAIPLSHENNNYLMLFRRQRKHEILWAGAPTKADSIEGGIGRLSPRRSFDAFVESVHGQARPFTPLEQRTAETMRAALRELINCGSRNVDAERQRSTERQELLIAELNHRVRNVLALIRGLITQTNGEGGDATSYVQSLNGRVQALARAHDRVTQQNWGPGPLNAIFEDEIAAYVPSQRQRFTIDGSKVHLHPQAYSAMALIVHELVTNCAKYGALSDNGLVKVTLEYKSGTGLYFKWRESGGPPVQVPTRRGFGSVIIERVLPYDLQGTALVHYLPDGLQGDFFIPDRHIASAFNARADLAATLASDPSMAIVAPGRARPLEGLSVLLVEDNLIVALEGEETLRALGAQWVHAASTIAAASQILENEHPNFAVLDINLGGESSLDFAVRLRGLGVPFIFASGYGDNISVGGVNQSVLTVSKPYDREHLSAAISHTLGAV